MPYGHLTEEMFRVLGEHVAGRVVYDLGAGDLGRTCDLVDLGAAKVIAVDKHTWRCERRPSPSKVEFRWETFEGLLNDLDHEGTQSFEVAFLAWPINEALPGLLQILRRAEVVCYLGMNDGCTACGWPDLYAYLATRQVLAEVNSRRNDLLIYGAHLERRRHLRPEESRGLSVQAYLLPEALAPLAEALGFVTQEDRTDQRTPGGLEARSSKLGAP